MISDFDLFADVQVELSSARSKFPGNEHMLAALTEEVGELAQALIDQSRGKKTQEQVYKEAIQVACMALRVASEGDQSFPYHPESGYRGKAWDGYQNSTAYHEWRDGCSCASCVAAEGQDERRQMGAGR